MCLISGPVRSVSNTKIFVSTSATHQLTVYENRVYTEHGNCMILPVPNKGNDPNNIRLQDLSAMPRLFIELEECFGDLF